MDDGSWQNSEEKGRSRKAAPRFAKGWLEEEVLLAD